MYGLDMLVKLAVGSQDLSTPRTIIKAGLTGVEQEEELCFSQSGRFQRWDISTFHREGN